jgi:hypothetical protein
LKYSFFARISSNEFSGVALVAVVRPICQDRIGVK